MTTAEALAAEIEPYTGNPLTLHKKLEDHGLIPDDTYLPDEDRKTIAICAVEFLVQMLSLSSKSEDAMSRGYSIKGIKDRIASLCRQHGLEEEDYVARPHVIVMSL